MRTRLFATVAALASACVSPSARGPREEPPRATSVAPAVSPRATPGRPELAERDTTGRDDRVARLRDRGLAAMDAGRFAEANEAFTQARELDPESVALAALQRAARAELEKTSRSDIDLAAAPFVVLERPPFDYELRAAAPVPAPTTRLGLRLVSKRKNEITDVDGWFATNGLRLPVWDVSQRTLDSSPALPAPVPTSFQGAPLVRAIAHADHIILMYGPDAATSRYLVVLDSDARPRVALDFERWLMPPSHTPGDREFVEQPVFWAEARGGVLFVTNFHRTYAKSSAWKNGYASALELATGRLLWRSAPLVANALTFVLHDGYVITGYGFTAEPDFLHVLDQTTGKTEERIPIASGPEYLLLKDDKLHVRAYDTDYVFALDAQPETPPAKKR